MGLHDSKINALDEILEETDGKIIIWANYIMEHQTDYHCF